MEPAAGAAPRGVDAAALQAALRRCGLSQFRHGQLEAITATLEGRDSLLILPTGGGKSLTYQLPPVARGNCFSVVISPLLALAADQVEKCLEAGLEAAMYNSSCSDQQKTNVVRELASSEPGLQLLYTTPESLLKPALREALQEAHASGTLCAFAIDEAHCISEWGHDFRPAYLQLASLKTDFPGVPVAALTASATPQVKANIVKCLGLVDPKIVAASFNRPNIELTVRHKALLAGGGPDDGVVEDLLAFIAARPGQCGIVYARLRSTCDWLASVLSGADLDVAKFHAGMDSDQRRKVLRDWIDGSVDIVVATIAFGMGIDRSNVRWVVHWNLPSSVEGYYQEAGRAGRDGSPSVSMVYESLEDADAVGKLESANRQGAVAAVEELLSTPGCRRRRLLAFFGEKRGGCDAAAELPCDYCADPRGWRRRLAERDARTSARTARERAKELGGGGGGSDGDGGSEGEEEGGGSRRGGAGGGWGPAARLEAGAGACSAAESEAGVGTRSATRDPPGVAQCCEEEAALPPPLPARPGQQQQQQQQPSRPVLSGLSRGRYGNGAARAASAVFKAPRMVKRPTAPAAESAPAGRGEGGPAAACAPEAMGGDENASCGEDGSGAAACGVALQMPVQPASVRALNVVPRLHKRPRGGAGAGAGSRGAAAAAAAAGAGELGATGGALGPVRDSGAAAPADEGPVAAGHRPLQQEQQEAGSGMPIGIHAAARRAFKPPLRR